MKLFNFVTTKEQVASRIDVPERDLLLATLERAVLDYYGNSEQNRDDAAQWLFEEEGEKAFSFNWVCAHLGIHPSALRTRLEDSAFGSKISHAHRWLRSRIQRKRRRSRATAFGALGTA